MQYSKETSALIARVAENIKDIKPGTVLTHLQLAEMLEVCYAKERSKYNNRIESLKKILADLYGVFLENFRGIGYGIVEPGKEIDVCDNTAQRGVKQIVRAARDSIKIRMDRIKDDEKRTYTIQKAQKIGNMMGLLRAGGFLEKKTNNKMLEANE